MNTTRSKLFGKITFLLLLWLFPIFGLIFESFLPKADAREGTYELTVEANRLSLEAQDASLRAILDEIGRKMNLEVLGEIPAKETISAEFHNLPLEQALQRLSSNFGYQVKSEQGGQEISKIFILPKGTGENTRFTLEEVAPRKEREVQKPERVIQAENAKKIELDKDPDNEKPARPEPFKFEFDPSALLGK